MLGLGPKKIVFLILLVIGVFAGFQYGRAFLTKYQFDDAVRQSVKYAATSRKTSEDVRREVVEKADELGIDIGPKDVHITKRGPAFELEVDYDWPVNLQVYQHVLTFNVSESGEMFGQ
jgi:hypothetical protein